MVLENVAGHLSLGFDSVLSDLARLGFDAEWGVLRASDVGACHRRTRLFVVATDATDVRGKRRWRLADRRQRPTDGDQPAVSEGWAEYAGAVQKHGRALGRTAPSPVDDRGRLDGRFVEWMMMLPEGWVTDVLTVRARIMKVLGNGVVYPQAAEAIRLLLARSEMSVS